MSNFHFQVGKEYPLCINGSSTATTQKDAKNYSKKIKHPAPRKLSIDVSSLGRPDAVFTMEEVSSIHRVRYSHIPPSPQLQRD